jgi:hypothetical protein
VSARPGSVADRGIAGRLPGGVGTRFSGTSSGSDRSILADGRLLSEIVDFFEEGVAAGKGVLELIGNDVAAFCDDLVIQARTYADR